MRSIDTFALGAAVIVAVVIPAVAEAHCDTRDGPVVNAARDALTAKDVNRILIWVKKGDEAEIRKAFDRTLAVRKLGGEAKELADTYFYETVVRLHRAGEGVPYTGLKPAGQDFGLAIPATDKALATGAPDPLVKMLKDAAEDEAVIPDRLPIWMAPRVQPLNGNS